jgi:hypothetical protein
MNEPFYLFVGLIAAFAAGLVIFFTTRKEDHVETPRHSKKKTHLHHPA